MEGISVKANWMSYNSMFVTEIIHSHNSFLCTHILGNQLFGLSNKLEEEDLIDISYNKLI